jgi:hypothetical protein
MMSTSLKTLIHACHILGLDDYIPCVCLKDSLISMVTIIHMKMNTFGIIFKFSLTLFHQLFFMKGICFVPALKFCYIFCKEHKLLAHFI